MANKRVRAIAYPSGEFWVETLTSDDRAKLLQKKDWEIREAAFYFHDYRYYDETFYIEPCLKEVEELCKILIEELKKGKLETPYSASGVPFLTHLPVETYIKWAEKNWEHHFPNKPLPNIVIAHHEQSQCSSDLTKQVQDLKKEGVPIDQLLDLIVNIHDISKAEDRTKTTKEIKNDVNYKKLVGAKNLHKFYPDLPSTKLLDVVIRIVKQGKRKASSKLR